MLKGMRRHAKYFYVLFFIVILSFIFWGVGTVDKSTSAVVAEVEKEKISLEEYWLAYDRAREYYKNNLKEAFTPEMEKQLNLKQQVLDSLIDERVLVIAAMKAGITVTDSELEDAIVNDPAFMRDGRFDRDVYISRLQLSRMTPQIFEPIRRRELTLVKMRRLIGESVDLTGADGSAPGMPAQARQAILFEMKNRALKSYIDGVKKEVKIKVSQQLIG